MKIALTIAGSDPSGGAGIQADIKTIHQHGVFATSVLTLLTVQNTQGVDAVDVLDPSFVVKQLRAVLEDVPPQAAKTGALGNAAVIEAVAEEASEFSFPLVVDPVMISKHGISLIDEDAISVLRDALLPRATLVTPNVHEASKLAGMEIENIDAMEIAAKKIRDLGAANVLIKGGNQIVDSTDVLLTDNGIYKLTAKTLETMHTHGSGCVLSASITARLAEGEEILPAVSMGKHFTYKAIESAPELGSGNGPVNMHVEF